MATAADLIVQELTASKGTAPLVGGVLIHGLLGAGGMGAVFRGTHLRLNIPVAVKFLFKQNEQDAEKFMNEASFAAKINHPNVVRIYDVGQAGKLLFIVQEFVHGRSAVEYLEKARDGQALSEDFVLSLGADVARGLSAMHAEGLLHLDIKPANVLVADKDGTGKILDLGAARRFGPSVLAQTTGKPQTVTVTPGYASPEQLRGLPLEPSSDIYSLGVTMYELLTGTYVQPLSPDPSPQWGEGQGRGARAAPAPEIRALRPEISLAAANLVKRCMAAQPAERFQSAPELLACLADVVSQRMLERSDDSLTLRRAAKLSNGPAMVICVLEDPEVCGALCSALRQSGFQARGFTAGPHVLEELAKAPPDLVVADLEMAQAGGLELCRAMRARDTLKDVPVVVLAAGNATSKMSLAVRAGATDCLLKPVDPDEVVVRAKCLTRISQVQREYAALQQQYVHFRERMAAMVQ